MKQSPGLLAHQQLWLLAPCRPARIQRLCRIRRQAGQQQLAQQVPHTTPLRLLHRSQGLLYDGCTDRPHHELPANDSATYGTCCLRRGQTPWCGRCPSALAAQPFSSTMIRSRSHLPGDCHVGSRTCCLRRSQTHPWRGHSPPGLGGERAERAPAPLTLSPPTAVPRVCSPTGQMQGMQLCWPPGGQHWSSGRSTLPTPCGQAALVRVAVAWTLPLGSLVCSHSGQGLGESSEGCPLAPPAAR